MQKYSPGEIKLFTMFGCADLVQHIDCPMTLYRICVEKAFLDNMQGSHVEALRRVYLALRTGAPFRMTDEFEQLVEFQEGTK